MAQVSKYLIRPDVWDRIFNLFLDSFLHNKNKKDMEMYVSAIFTPTERIMFAKRFAACVLLAKGQDYRSVARILRMSPPTIAKMSFKLKYEGEVILPTLEKTLKKQSTDIFWEELKEMLNIHTKSTLKDPHFEKAKREQRMSLEYKKRTL